MRRASRADSIERALAYEEVAKLSVRAHSLGLREYCAKRLGGDPVVGDEAAHRAFVAFWRALPNFKGDSTVKTFLFGCARRVCLEVAKEHKLALRHEEWSAAEEREGLFESAPGAEDWLLREERREAFAAIFARLDERSRWLLRQRFAEERPYQEMLPEFMAKFDRSITTEGGLRSAVFQALGKLERKLRRSDVDL